MKRVIQSIRSFCGRYDQQTIIGGGSPQPSNNYTNDMYGKIKLLSVLDHRCPILSFPYFTNTSTGKYNELYVCGKYYFLMNNTVHTIRELSSYFGAYVDNISFAGYLHTHDGKAFGLVALGNNMYTSGDNNQYKKVGMRSDFIPDNIISIFYDGVAHCVIDCDGNLNAADVTISGHSVTIKIGKAYAFNYTVRFLHPTCCSFQRVSNKLKYTYVNSDSSYISLDDTSGTRVVTSGEMDVDIDVLNCVEGSHYVYTLFGSSPIRKAALVTAETRFADTVPYTISNEYNDLRQLTSVTEQSYIWNTAMTGFSLQRKKRTEYEYVWESSASYAQLAQNSVGLLGTVTEKVQEQNGTAEVSMDLNKSFTTYNVVSDRESASRLVYKSIAAAKNLSGDDKVIINEILSYSKAGQPELAGAVAGMGANLRLVDMSIYSKTIPDLLIASFNGITFNGAKRSAGYCGFEPYEEIDTSEHGKIKTPYFIFEGAQLSFSSRFGTKSAYFKNGGKIILSDNIHMTGGIKYVFSYYTKWDRGNWVYMEVFKFLSEMSNKVVTTIPNDYYVDIAAFREVSCEVHINLYNECGYRNSGCINNNGVPTVAVLDKGGRTMYSYQCELVLNSGVDKFLTENIALNQISMKGYARLGGRNRWVIQNGKFINQRFNTITQLSFRKCAKYIPCNSNIGLSDNNSCYLMGKGDFEATFWGSSFSVAVRLACSRLEYAYNESLIGTSSLGENKTDTDYYWSIALKTDVMYIFIDNLLVHQIYNIQTVKNVRVNQIGDFHANLGKVVLAENYDIHRSYFDYSGRIVQSHTIKEMYGMTRDVMEAYWYNRSDQLVSKSLKGAFPCDKTTKMVTDHYPLLFHDNFAQINWSAATAAEPRGILYGDLADYYRTGVGKGMTISDNDYEFPYYYYEYETGGRRRLKCTMQPGADGSSFAESFNYQNTDTYETYAKAFNPIHINYGSSTDKIDIGEQGGGISQYSMFDQDSNVYGNSLRTTLNPGSLLDYKIRSGIVGGRVPDMKILGQTYYQAGSSSDVFSGNYQGFFNRVEVTWGKDYGYKILLKDVSGNGRLILNGLRIDKDSVFTYFKYDKRNRLIASGSLTSTRGYSISDLLTSIENPSFPDFGTSPSNTFEYDIPECGFSLGKLCKAHYVFRTVDETYYYDYLGHVTQKDTNILESTYRQYMKQDNLSNLQSIDSEHVLTYRYSGNWPIEILYDDRVEKTKTILTDAEYDIYGRLVSYRDVHNVLINYSYDILGRQIFIGQAKKTGSSNVAVAKNYTKNSDQYQRVNNILYMPENMKRNLTYDSFLRLRKAEGYEDQITYDDNGNLTEFTLGRRNRIEYWRGSNQVYKVQNEPLEISYNNKGVATYLHMIGRSITIEPDLISASKVSRLKIVNEKEGLTYSIGYYYDIQGNIIFRTGKTQTGKLNIYDMNGNLIGTSSIKYQSVTNEQTYVYVGSRLIAQFNEKDKTWIGLCYDDSKTLWVASFSDSVKSYQYSAWGKPQGNDLSKITFYYMGMEYDTNTELYMDRGALYLPQLGITLSPILGSGAFTPYRQHADNPVL